MDVTGRILRDWVLGGSGIEGSPEAKFFSFGFLALVFLWRATVLGVAGGTCARGGVRACEAWV